MRLFKKKPKLYRVRVTYRSGVQFDMDCEDYNVEFNEDEGTLIRFSVKGLRDKHNAVPKFWNVRAIESVWELT